MAEIKLLKLMQLEINRRTLQLEQSRAADGGDLSGPQQRELDDLASEQGRLADLLAKMLQALQGPGLMPFAGRNSKSTINALLDAVSAAPADDPRLPLARHTLAAALAQAGRGREALEQFRLLEPWVGAQPWTYHRDPVAAFDRARAIAILRAGRRSATAARSA